MSDFDDDEKPRKVGYKSPPVEHQFQKKPDGAVRPPRKRKRKAKQNPNISAVPGDVLLDEMSRLVTAGEDGSKITIHQALIRAAQKKAAMGSVVAQKSLMDAIDAALKERRDVFMNLLGVLADYKAAAAANTPKYRRARKSGLLPPPEDIRLDIQQLRIGFRGGIGPEERAAHLELRRRHSKVPEHIAKLKRQFRLHPEDPELPPLLASVQKGQALLEESMPLLDDWQWFHLQPQPQAS